MSGSNQIENGRDCLHLGKWARGRDWASNVPILAVPYDDWNIMVQKRLRPFPILHWPPRPHYRGVWHHAGSAQSCSELLGPTRLCQLFPIDTTLRWGGYRVGFDGIPWGGDLAAAGVFLSGSCSQIVRGHSVRILLSQTDLQTG